MVHVYYEILQLLVFTVTQVTILSRAAKNKSKSFE